MKQQGNAVSFPFNDIVLNEFLGEEKEVIFKLLPRTPHGIALIDGDGKFIHVNEEFTNLTGYTLEDVPNQTEWLEKAFPNEAMRNRIMEFWKADMQKKAAHRVYQVVCKDGQSKLFHFRYFQLAQGRAVCTLSDITEQYMMDESIREVDEKFRQVFEKPQVTAREIEEGPRQAEMPQNVLQYKKDESRTAKENAIPVAEEETNGTEEVSGRGDDKKGECEMISSEKEKSVSRTFYTEPAPRPPQETVPAGSARKEKAPADPKITESPVKEPKATARSVQKQTAAATVLMEENGIISLVNREFELLSGYAREEVEGKKEFADFLNSDDAKHLRETQQSLIDLPVGPGHSMECRLIDRDGREKNISISLVLVPGTTKVMASIVDNTEKGLYVDFSAQNDRSLNDLIKEYAPMGIMTVNSQGGIDYANREMLRISNATPEQFKGLNVFNHPGYQRVNLDKKIKMGLKGEAFRLESVEYVSFFGKRRTIRNFNGIPFEENGERKLLLFVEDVTRQRANEQQLAFQANHDILTGLPNKNLFSERLKLAMKSAQQYEQKLAIMFLDIDKFKEVNHTMGYKVGDDLLKSISERVRRIIRQSDTLARISGDEFLLIIQNINRLTDADMVAQKILNTFDKAFVIGGHTLDVTCSIGISLYPDNGEDIDNLVKCADIAMTYAKRNGTCGFKRFSD